MNYANIYTSYSNWEDNESPKITFTAYIKGDYEHSNFDYFPYSKDYLTVHSNINFLNGYHSQISYTPRNFIDDKIGFFIDKGEYTKDLEAFNDSTYYKYFQIKFKNVQKDTNGNIEIYHYSNNLNNDSEYSVDYESANNTVFGNHMKLKLSDFLSEDEINEGYQLYYPHLNNKSVLSYDNKFTLLKNNDVNSVDDILMFFNKTPEVFNLLTGETLDYVTEIAFINNDNEIKTKQIKLTVEGTSGDLKVALNDNIMIGDANHSEKIITALFKKDQADDSITLIDDEINLKFFSDQNIDKNNLELVYKIQNANGNDEIVKINNFDIVYDTNNLGYEKSGIIKFKLNIDNKYLTGNDKIFKLFVNEISPDNDSLKIIKSYTSKITFVDENINYLKGANDSHIFNGSQEITLQQQYDINNLKIDVDNLGDKYKNIITDLKIEHLSGQNYKITYNLNQELLAQLSKSFSLDETIINYFDFVVSEQLNDQTSNEVYRYKLSVNNNKHTGDNYGKPVRILEKDPLMHTYDFEAINQDQKIFLGSDFVKLTNLDFPSLNQSTKAGLVLAEQVSSSNVDSYFKLLGKDHSFNDHLDIIVGYNEASQAQELDSLGNTKTYNNHMNCYEYNFSYYADYEFYKLIDDALKGDLSNDIAKQIFKYSDDGAFLEAVIADEITLPYHNQTTTAESIIRIPTKFMTNDDSITVNYAIDSENPFILDNEKLLNNILQNDYKNPNLKYEIVFNDNYGNKITQLDYNNTTNYKIKYYLVTKNEDGTENKRSNVSDIEISFTHMVSKLEKNIDNNDKKVGSIKAKGVSDISDGSLNLTLNFNNTSTNQAEYYDINILLDISYSTLVTEYASNNKQTSAYKLQINSIMKIIDKYESMGIDSNKINLDIKGYAVKIFDLDLNIDNSSYTSLKDSIQDLYDIDKVKKVVSDIKNISYTNVNALEESIQTLVKSYANNNDTYQSDLYLLMDNMILLEEGGVYNKKDIDEEDILKIKEIKEYITDNALNINIHGIQIFNSISEMLQSNNDDDNITTQLLSSIDNTISIEKINDSEGNITIGINKNSANLDKYEVSKVTVNFFKADESGNYIEVSENIIDATEINAGNDYNTTIYNNDIKSDPNLKYNLELEFVNVDDSNDIFTYNSDKLSIYDTDGLI